MIKTAAGSDFLNGNVKYQAIETRFHGPTDTKGSRYSATADAGRVYVHADDALDPLGNHVKAAAALPYLTSPIPLTANICRSYRDLINV